MLNYNTKPNFSIHTNNKDLNLRKPVVMGILNLSPDSFFDGGFYQSEVDLESRLEQMVSEGAAIIDIGASTSRPNSEMAVSKTEIERLKPVLKLLHKYPNTLFSIDTYLAETAQFACENGFDIINDISAGQIDPMMLGTVARLQKPYIAMHMQGTPTNMQVEPIYEHVTKDILFFFEEKLKQLKSEGIQQIILDVGFGFGKTLKHNYQLLNTLNLFESIGYPILVGLSRKSMIYNVLATDAERALNGTTALNMLALNNGANILRVHDVKAALECIQLFEAYNMNA